MKFLRKTGGFTLVELIVAIAVGSMVTIAATSLLLLGLRLDSHSRHTITRQNTARVITSMLEDFVSEGSVGKVINGPEGWYICSKEDAQDLPENLVPDGDGIATYVTENRVLVAFKAESGMLYTGGTVKTDFTWLKDKDDWKLTSVKYTYTDGNPILKDVRASNAVLSEENLLTVSVETKDGTYWTSTYCRLALKEDITIVDGILEELEKEPELEDDPEGDDPQGTELDSGTELARREFLRVLASQINSDGIIKEKIVQDGKPDMYINGGLWYAQWYNDSWPADTPWCACFVVWGLDHEARWKYAGEQPALLRTGVDRNIALAHVDAFAEYLDGTYRVDCGVGAESEDEQIPVEDKAPGWYRCVLDLKDGTPASVRPSEYGEPVPGDLIFFRWNPDSMYGSDYDGDHVGVVLTVVDGDIYTIEGNTADMVAVRKYRIDDPRIMGYGVLDWMTNSEMLKQSTVSGIETE